MRRVPAGVGWRGRGISSTSSSEPFRKKIRLISSINGKSLSGRSQRITSSSNPSRKHAPRAATCQLTRLESSRNSSTYLSNLRPPCRNPHSPSSAEVISNLVQYSVTVVRGCQERGDVELRSKTLIFKHRNTEQRSLETGTHWGNDVNTGQRHWEHWGLIKGRKWRSKQDN